MFLKKYITALLFICVLPRLLFAQIDNAGIIDRHFEGILFPQVYKELVSTRIAYPGLRNPERYSVSAGLLPDFSGENWAALYAWGEWANGPATAGAWLGNAAVNSSSYGETFWIYDTYVKERSFSIRSAAWFTPFRNRSFKGVSVTYDAYSERRDAEIEESGITNTSSMDSVLFSVIALTELNVNLHLRAGVNSRSYSASMDSEERIIDGVFVGILDRNNRALELHVSNLYYSIDDYYGEQVSDTVNVSLLFSGGKVMHYHDHRFFYGLKGKCGVSLPSKSDGGVGRFEYWRHINNAKRRGATFDAVVSAPLIFDVSLFKTLRGVLSVNPQINYSNTYHPQKSKSRHNLSLASSHPLLSFYRTIGNNVEFAIKPSIENEVFFSAAEVRYKF